MEAWERNDRFTRAAEWLEFGLRCLIAPFAGSAAAHVFAGLKADYQRLREGRATYWYDRRHESKP